MQLKGNCHVSDALIESFTMNRAAILNKTQFITSPPPYSPDIAPSDICLFPRLKMPLEGINLTMKRRLELIWRVHYAHSEWVLGSRNTDGSQIGTSLKDVTSRITKNNTSVEIWKLVGYFWDRLILLERIHKQEMGFIATIAASLRLTVILSFLAGGKSFRSLMFTVAIFEQAISITVPKCVNLS